SSAITIGQYFNFSLDDIKQAIESYTPQNNRSKWINIEDKKNLLDAYNANPSSMQVAIQNFKQLEDDSKLMILGDMFELGIEANNELLTIFYETIDSSISTIFIGDHFFENQIANNQIRYFKNLEEVFSHLETHQINQNLILIKGSRAMALERILNYL